MATPSRVNLELTNTDWTEIVVNPSTEGYTKMLVEKLEIGNVFWSTLNTTTLPTSVLPNEPAMFDYNIFVKSNEASISNPISLSITRL